MRSVVPVSLLLLLPAAALGDETVVDGHRFVIPEGFTIERVAGPPLVDRPITAAFDDLGRLYVTEASGTNDPAPKQLADKPHRIVRLEDADGDGRFDTSVAFAEGLMLPEGTMWRDGSLYVAAPPQIWKFTDTDDDGRADRREVWFDGQTLTGCANDLHGPYPGPDGRIYWTKGAFAEQSYDLRGPVPFRTRAAHVFRAKADGTAIEPVMTGGMDNPVDVAFTAAGDRIVNGTFFVQPGGGQRDGLLHAVYGGIYGKLHDPIYDPAHKWTGPDVLPVMVHLGPAAPSGLHRLESDGLGYRDQIINTCFNLHKVTRHALKRAGATFATEDADLLVAADGLDFHPTDVVEDADGSLLVIDTGGWYKLCCPTSQLHKPDILGAIYRLRNNGTPRAADPRGLKIAWNRLGPKELVGLLGDFRPVVRERATRALAAADPEAAVAALAKVVREPFPLEIQRQAVWTATRIDHPGARRLTRNALAFHGELVRRIALHAASLWRDADATPALIEAVKSSPSGFERRAAAEALGRIGDPASVPTLLAASASTSDRFLEHSLIYAAIEIGQAGPIRDVLEANATPDPKVRRAALIALDGVGGLSADGLAADLDAADPALKEAAWWIAGRHPEWGEALADVLGRRLRDDALPAAERADLEARLARFAGSAAIRKLLADAASRGNGPARLSALKAMAKAPAKKAPEGWPAAIVAGLGDADDAVLAAAVAASRALPAPLDADLADALGRLGRRADVPESLRLAALVAAGASAVDADRFAFLVDHLGTDWPVATRAAAADVLAKAKLTAAQRVALAGAIRSAGPLEIGRLLAAFEGVADDEIGRALVEALRASPALPALRADQVRTGLAKFGPEVRAAAAPIFAAIDADADARRAKIDKLVPLVASGDVRRGQAVFHGAKAACVGCHAMGYVGGQVGPDLTRIGAIRSERDLLEAIVEPSASFVRSYEPMTVATTDGRVFNGIVRGDTPDGLVLATSATEEARIPRDSLEEMRPGTVSVMPAGLDLQLSPQELADLVAFLKASQR